jgi:NifU-like protein involved in Fe-S cluster formation
MDEKQIIQIASDTEYFGLKNEYPLKAKVKNKVCGDEISVEVSNDIKSMRFETEACIFTQASAALLANHFKKFKSEDFSIFLNTIKDKLEGKKKDLPVKIKEFDLLLKQENKARKECISLPFQAVIKAIHD